MLATRRELYVDETGFMVEGEEGTIEVMKKICDDQKKKLETFIEKLRSIGIKALHYNDGWHNRKDRSFRLVYPSFDDGVEIGDNVALGCDKEYIVVTVREINRNFCGKKRFHY